MSDFKAKMHHIQIRLGQRRGGKGRGGERDGRLPDFELATGLANNDSLYILYILNACTLQTSFFGHSVIIIIMIIIM